MEIKVLVLCMTNYSLFDEQYLVQECLCLGLCFIVIWDFRLSIFSFISGPVLLGV